MPVREFTDSRGRRWRAWDVTPESIHPQTKGEDYLAEAYRDGWVVFEEIASGEKRRLTPLPANWHRLPEEELELLLDEAEYVLPQKRSVRTERAAVAQAPSEELEVQRPVTPGEVDMGELGVVRSFLYPGGRIWSAYVYYHPRGRGPSVLRFTSGAREIDLASWPPDWADLSDTELVELLRRAGARSRPWQPGAPTRRYDDPKAEV